MFINGRVTLGCDPELFFEKDGQIIGSERVIPEGGITWMDKRIEYRKSPITGHLNEIIKEIEIKTKDVVRDGVQVELNPSPEDCRVMLGSNIANAFFNLKRLACIQNNEVKLSSAQVVEVAEAELKALSPKSRRLGCMPSFNVYEPAKTLGVDPETYRIRSAGGHIHLGDTHKNPNLKNALEHPEILVPVLDVVLGNTCVLLDRDPANKVRREVYGRAGEFRRPSHGIEYRTLSNFWIRNYTLMSFVMGMARFACNIVASSTEKENYAKELLDLVDIEKVAHAINTNNIVSARANFRKVAPYLVKLAENSEPNPAYHGDELDIPLTCDKDIEALEYVSKEGIDRWFSTDPLTHWTEHYRGMGKSTESYYGGWENFITRTIYPLINAK